MSNFITKGMLEYLQIAIFLKSVIIVVHVKE